MGNKQTRFLFVTGGVVSSLGKGVAAALLMSNFQAKLRANIKYNHKNMSLNDLIHEN